MNGVAICCLHLMSIACFAKGDNLDINSFEMSTMCGKSLNFIWQSIFTAEVTFRPEINDTDDKRYISCDLDIMSWRHMDQIMFHFTDLDISTNCSDTFIQVLEGAGGQAEPVEGLPTFICGEMGLSLLFKTFKSRDRYLRLRFQGSTSLASKSGFSLVLVAFHSGRCQAYEHECQNGRCIWPELICNGNNPCGDNSDCPEAVTAVTQEVVDNKTSDSQTLVAAIVSSALIIVFGIIALVVFFRCYRKRKLSSRDRFPQTDHARVPTSETELAIVEDINIRRLLSPPSYNSLEPQTDSPREQHRQESTSQHEDADVSTSQSSPCHSVTDCGENPVEIQRETPEVAPPPSYECVMTHKEKFHVSSTKVNEV